MADALGSSLRQSCRAARLSANLERSRAPQCPAAPHSFPVRSVHQRSARKQFTVSASFDGDIPEECVPVLDKFSAFERVKVLSEALPYLQRFQGKTIVIKYGGAAMKDPTLKEGVIKDLVLLACVGIRPVLVHGGGPEINSWLNKVGIEAQFKNGLRVTDAATMEVVEMVLTGRVNKSLVTLIQQAGGRAVGLCGKDSEILQARQMVEKDIGYVGEVTKVNAGIIETLVRDGYIPVLATVASSPTGESLNVNADIAAGELAAALRAEKLILMTDVPGVMKDKDDISTKYTELDIRNTRQLVAEGIIAGGMIPKVECCVRCLAQGVAATHIIDGRQNHSLLMELLTDEGVGTMIVGSSRATSIHQQEQQIREAVAA